MTSLQPPTQIGPYTITREIGRGGMGVVYLARDTKLDRDVALKVLPSEFADDASRLARFEREAKLLASLNHPNILTVHDVGRENGISFVVMELLDGVNLRARLRGGAMPWTEVVEVGGSMLRGLAAAHRQHIVHRDLKPENVFLDSHGLVKILDFGLARRTQALDSRTMPMVTRFGQVVGTPGYMSPEQLKGGDVDHRTDLFAVGCILHELLTGTPTFCRQTEAETTAALLTEAPASLEECGDSVPPVLQRIIMQSLEKDPESRFASADEMRQELEQCIAVPAHITSGAPDGSVVAVEERSIAVLPFINQSSDPENEYFSDGITEDLINLLACTQGLRVAARTSAFSFKGKQTEISEIGRQLNVDTVLEGSVRKAGDRLRITAQLVDVADGYPLWSERFDRRLDDIFKVQDEIAASILEKLTLTFGVSSSDRRPVAPTENMDAYEHFLRARQHIGRGYGLDLLEALDALDLAIGFDPEFAQAHAVIAEVYAALGYMAALPQRESMPKAKAAAERALDLNDSLAEAHCALGCVAMQYEWDWTAAEECFKKALDLNPNFVQTHYHYGHPYLCFVADRIDEGLEVCRRAMALDPLAVYPRHGYIANLLAANRMDEVVEAATESLGADPTAFHYRRLRGIAHFLSGRTSKALADLECAVRISGRHPWALYELGSMSFVARDENRADDIESELQARSQYSHVHYSVLALIAGWKGKLDQAFDFLERGLETKDGIVYGMTTWPMAMPLWDHPRFSEFLARLNLPAPGRNQWKKSSDVLPLLALSP